MQTYTNVTDDLEAIPSFGKPPRFCSHMAMLKRGKDAACHSTYSMWHSWLVSFLRQLMDETGSNTSFVILGFDSRLA